MRVVLDTNIIVSGLNYHGNEALILDPALTQEFDLYRGARVVTASVFLSELEGDS